MGAQGTALLDFGAFPGGSDASVAVADAAILAGSLAEAWLFPADTVDHLADEHRVESLEVMAGNVVAGVGFTIYGTNENQINEPTTPLSQSSGRDLRADPDPFDFGGVSPRIYGKWNVGWVWN